MKFSDEELSAANINPETGLATDYLNHFNELDMLLEMVPSMPDCIEDISAWEPRDYPTHFEVTNYPGKEIAIAAYIDAKPVVKAEFDTIIKALSDTLENLRGQILTASCDGSIPIPNVSDALNEDVRPMIAMAGALINGKVTAADINIDSSHTAQDAIDTMFA
ncbi:MAG: hypothetical protein ABJO09_07350 [Hyphomicrobiales bacterium]